MGHLDCLGDRMERQIVEMTRPRASADIECLGARGLHLRNVIRHQKYVWQYLSHGIQSNGATRRSSQGSTLKKKTTEKKD